MIHKTMMAEVSPAEALMQQRHMLRRDLHALSVPDNRPTLPDALEHADGSGRLLLSPVRERAFREAIAPDLELCDNSGDDFCGLATLRNPRLQARDDGLSAQSNLSETDLP